MPMATSFNTWLSTYAIRNGIYKFVSDKYELKITLADNYDDLMMTGRYSMGVLATASFAVAAANQSPKLEAISTYITHTGAQKANGVNFIMTLAGSNISSPADLVGKKVGVPRLTASSTSTMLALLKTNYGITLGANNLVVGSNVLLMEWLKSGEIDAALLGQNTGVQAILDPTYKVVWDLDKAFVQNYGVPQAASLLVVNPSFHNEHARLVKDIYEFLRLSSAYGEQHIDELAPIFAAEREDLESVGTYIRIYNEHSGCDIQPINGKVLDGIMAIFGFVKDNSDGTIASFPDISILFKEP